MAIPRPRGGVRRYGGQYGPRAATPAVLGAAGFDPASDPAVHETARPAIVTMHRAKGLGTGRRGWAPGEGAGHRAKGLEFRAAAVIACDDDVLPDPDRLAAAADPASQREAHDTERHLLCVACTRVRDALLVSGVEPSSEFLDDLAAA